MKSAAWVIGLVVGVTGCSGAVVGGDLGQGGAAGNFSGAGGNAPDPGAGGNAPDPGVGGGGGNVVPAAECHSTIDAWIAFDSDAADSNRDLYVVRPDGTQVTRLTSDASVEKEPFFSPVGDRLSFTSDRTGSMQIYVMDLASRSVTQVTHRAEGADQSSFSADGNLLAFHSGDAVYTIEPDGSNETLIATGPVVAGSHIHYLHPRFIGNAQLVFDRDNELYAVNLDTTNFRTIVSVTTSPVTYPSLSPLTNEVAYATRCKVAATQELEAELSIWIAPTTGTSNFCGGQRITPAGDVQTNTNPAWGPASTFAYERVDSSTNIARLTLKGRAASSVPCSLTPGSQDSRNPNWSPEGLEIQEPL